MFHGGNPEHGAGIELQGEEDVVVIADDPPQVGPAQVSMGQKVRPVPIHLPFSKWEQIFKDPMTTAAAIDRLVHHSVILELNLPSYRMATARRKGQKDKEKKT